MLSLWPFSKCCGETKGREGLVPAENRPLMGKTIEARKMPLEARTNAEGGGAWTETQ